jgi:hypothetical protein
MYIDNCRIDFLFIDQGKINISASFFGAEYFRHPWFVVFDKPFDCESSGIVIQDGEDERGG